MGNAWLSLKQYDQAIESYQRALSASPKNAEILLNLGLAYREKNQIEAAIATFESAIQANKGFKEAYDNLGNLYLKLGQHQKGLEVIRRGSGFIRFNLGRGFSIL
ncbi:MAG TPA: tetratricopeptide repeat protein [Methylophilaceae bacterium]|jgi:tetratricopeptide (TPR) repeat protein